MAGERYTGCPKNSGDLASDLNFKRAEKTVVMFLIHSALYRWMTFEIFL